MKDLHRGLLVALMFAFIAAASTTTAGAASSTLATIRTRGLLTCGVIQEDAEYSTDDDHGSRGQFDADICMAIAAASTGQKAAVNLVTFLDSETAAAALRVGKVDVIASIGTDPTRLNTADLRFTQPILMDGVGFLVPRSKRFNSVRDLASRKICFLAETEVEVRLRAWFEQRHLDLLPFPFQEEGEMEAAYITNNCAALAGDVTRLMNTWISFGSVAKDYTLLPDVVSSDPLAVATSSSDAAWSEIVGKVVELLIASENAGVTLANLKAIKTTGSPTAKRLFEAARGSATRLGLESEWAANMLKSTGNLEEIYERTYGEKMKVVLPPG
jgi:general L-amino acid transport system substrate-binding protein